jgi:hypothetical protein
VTVYTARGDGGTYQTTNTERAARLSRDGYRVTAVVR